MTINQQYILNERALPEHAHLVFSYDTLSIMVLLPLLEFVYRES